MCCFYLYYHSVCKVQNVLFLFIITLSPNYKMCSFYLYYHLTKWGVFLSLCVCNVTKCAGFFNGKCSICLTAIDIDCVGLVDIANLGSAPIQYISCSYQSRKNSCGQINYMLQPQRLLWWLMLTSCQYFRTLDFYDAG